MANDMAFGTRPADGARGVRTLTMLYGWALTAAFALLPTAVVVYLVLFQTPPLIFFDQGFHEIAIGLSIVLSAFVAYVTWRCYDSSGEPFLKWLTLGLVGFAVVYAPHGILTRTASWNMFLFLLYGPASRMVMAAFLFAGLMSFGAAPHPPDRRRGRGAWWPWFAGLAAVDVAVFAAAMSPLAGHPLLRLGMEGGALALGVVGVAAVLVRRIRAPLIQVYALALCCFVQSSAAFFIAKPWQHLWWIAHAIFAGGFFLLSYGVVRAFHTTRSFAGVYSQEEMMERLRVAKVAAEEALAANRRMQATLIESEKMAALGSLVAGVAHEINTPVGIVLTAATHLEGETAKVARRYGQGDLDGDGLEEYFATAGQAARMIVANAGRAGDLIQSFKQVAVDQTADDRREFELNGYLEELLLSLRPQLRKTGLTVGVDCPDGIRMDSHPGALSRCLTNLVMNAIVHAYEPGQVGRLSITVTRSGTDMVELVFRDDGKGIPAEIQPRVFEPFVTTRRGSGGSGLGLHIAYNAVVTALKGTITLSSAPGRGTAFALRLPLAPSARMAAPSAILSATPSAVAEKSVTEGATAR